MASISPNEAQVSDVKRKKEREKKLQTTLAWLGHAGRGREREEGCGLGGHVSLAEDTYSGHNRRLLLPLLCV